MVPMYMIVISYFDDDTSAEIRGMAMMTEDSDLYHDIITAMDDI